MMALDVENQWPLHIPNPMGCCSQSINIKRLQVLHNWGTHTELVSVLKRGPRKLSPIVNYDWAAHIALIISSPFNHNLFIAFSSSVSNNDFTIFG